MIDQNPFKNISSKSFLFPGFVIVLRRVGVTTAIYLVKDGERQWWGCASGEYLKSLILELIKTELNL